MHCDILHYVCKCTIRIFINDIFCLFHFYLESYISYILLFSSRDRGSTYLLVDMTEKRMVEQACSHHYCTVMKKYIDICTTTMICIYAIIEENTQSAHILIDDDDINSVICLSIQ